MLRRTAAIVPLSPTKMRLVMRKRHTAAPMTPAPGRLATRASVRARALPAAAPGLETDRWRPEMEVVSCRESERPIGWPWISTVAFCSPAGTGSPTVIATSEACVAAISSADIDSTLFPGISPSRTATGGRVATSS